MSGPIKSACCFSVSTLTNGTGSQQLTDVTQRWVSCSCHLHFHPTRHFPVADSKATSTVNIRWRQGSRITGSYGKWSSHGSPPEAAPEGEFVSALTTKVEWSNHNQRHCPVFFRNKSLVYHVLPDQNPSPGKITVTYTGKVSASISTRNHFMVHLNKKLRPRFASILFTWLLLSFYIRVLVLTITK